MQPNSNIPLRSLTSNEVEYFIKGNGKIILDGITFEVKSGDSLFIPKGTKQKTLNDSNSELEFLSIVEPAWTPLVEERFE